MAETGRGRGLEAKGGVPGEGRISGRVLSNRDRRCRHLARCRRLVRVRCYSKARCRHRDRRLTNSSWLLRLPGRAAAVGFPAAISRFISDGQSVEQSARGWIPQGNFQRPQIPHGNFLQPQQFAPQLPPAVVPMQTQQADQLNSTVALASNQNQSAQQSGTQGVQANLRSENKRTQKAKTTTDTEQTEE